MLSQELIRCHCIRSLIECNMTINSDSPEANIYSTKFFDHILNMCQVFGIRENSLFFRHYEFWFNFGVNRSVHKSTEAQFILFVNPFFIICQVFIHINKPYIFQADILLIYHIYKIRILSYRTYRADKYCILTKSIFTFDFFYHFICH